MLILSTLALMVVLASLNAYAILALRQKKIVNQAVPEVDQLIKLVELVLTIFNHEKSFFIVGTIFAGIGTYVGFEIISRGSPSQGLNLLLGCCFGFAAMSFIAGLYFQKFTKKMV